MKSIQFIFKALCIFLAIALPGVSKADSGLATSNLSAVEQAVAELNQYRQLQQSIGVQDAELSYGMRKALVLADLLLSPSGTLIVSLCQAVKPYFVPDEPEEYEVNIGRILDQLDSSWQAYLDRIFKPGDPNGVSNLVLRALLGISPEEQVKNRHAKVAILASLFAPYNQGPVGDCFAVAGLIRDHDEYYLHSAKDDAEIVQYGYVNRLVNNQPDHFFFLPTIADGDLSNSFTIDASGNIGNSNVSLLSAPGFVSAVRMMGGNSISNLSQHVISLLFQGSSADSVQVSGSQVIRACAQAIAASQSNVDIEALVAKGEYAFSSLTNNPVLRAVECVFAAMAEDRAQDSTRGNVNDCVAQALKNQWGSLDQDFQTAFMNNFNASYRLVYNPNIPLPQVSADGSSTDGGFQLFKRTTNMTNIGTRLATPQDFRQLVLDAIAMTESQFGSNATNLKDFVLNGTFLRDALWAYDSANQQEPDPVGNYQKLSRTPMQSCDGDNPFEVSDIDTGTTYDGDVQTYTPNNMYDLINWCLNLAKIAPAEMVPMDSPQHAFNFVPNNSDLAAFVKSGISSDQWIRTILSTPGMKISTRLIDSNTRTALSNAMYAMISNALPEKSYQQLTSSLLGRSLTVQQYAQGLVDGINNLLGSDDGQASRVALALDATLLQVLPPQDSSMLQKTAIRFAFTNWNDETKDIYFCAYFNPRTQQVAFATIDEDKTNLQPMDEAEWINHQQWDVDLRPYAPK